MEHIINGLDILIANGECDKVKAATIEGVLNEIEMTKKEKIINQHKEKFSVWQGNNGMWYTYLPDETKPHGRRQIKAVTEEKLNNKIINFYHERENEISCNTVTFRDFYPLWLEYKSLHTKSSTYIRKIDSDWNRFYKNSKIVDIPLKKLSYTQLDAWANGLVKERNLSKRQYYNMSVIMRQGLAYAVDSKLLKENPFERVHVSAKMFRTEKKPEDQTQVFLVEEQPQITQKAFDDFKKNDNTAPLAIALCFELGARVGEMVGLKWSDLHEEIQNHIHIQRMEVRDFIRNPDGTWIQLPNKIVENTKTEDGNRNTYLTNEARRILKLIKNWNVLHGYENSEFIFVDKQGERIHIRALDYRLRKYCQQIGINSKSMHKIRKTYISSLIDSNLVNLNVIRSMVGHADEQTTLKNYCFNRVSDMQTQHNIETALSQTYSRNA